MVLTVCESVGSVLNGLVLPRSGLVAPQRPVNMSTAASSAGTPVGDVLTCKWCKRTSQDKNPIESQASVKSKLQFRRERGSECTICSRFLKRHRIGVDLKSYAKKLDSEPSEQETYTQQLSEFEAQLNGGGPIKRAKHGEAADPSKVIQALQTSSLEAMEKRIKTERLKIRTTKHVYSGLRNKGPLVRAPTQGGGAWTQRRLGGEVPTCTRCMVEISAFTYLHLVIPVEARKNLGVFWPQGLWKQHHSDKPLDPKELVTLNEDGVNVRGVVKDPSFGTPIGTTNLSYIRGKHAQLVTSVLSSEDAVADGEVEVAWKTVAQAMQVTNKEVNLGTDEAPNMVHGLCGAKKRKHDEDDLLSELWDASALGCSFPGEEEPKAGKHPRPKAEGVQSAKPPAVAKSSRSFSQVQKRFVEHTIGATDVCCTKQQVDVQSGQGDQFVGGGGLAMFPVAAFGHGPLPNRGLDAEDLTSMHGQGFFGPFVVGRRSACCLG